MEKTKSLDNKKAKPQLSSSRREQTLTPNNVEKFFKKLNQNILKALKNIKEKEKNFENMNIYKKIKLIKNENIWNGLFNQEQENKNILNKNNYKKTMFKRNYSYFSKNIKTKKKERDILSCLNVFSNKKRKDFASVTSNINYLLKRNQTMLMREESFHINNLNYYTPYNNNLDKNIFKKNNFNFSSRNGMFGKKEKIPLIYELSFTHRNDYTSKSEKSRHEILLNELNKLKFYLEQNPNDELLIIKDFLQKFNIKNISKISDEKLMSICKLICKSNENQLLKIIKPDSNIKIMIYNLLNLPYDMKKINNKNFNIYNSYYSPQNTNRKNLFKKNKTYDNFRVNKIKKYFDVYDTNSKLKYLENQQDLYKPNKNYSQHFDLLISEIGKEVKEIEENIKKRREIENDKSKDDLFFITQSKNKSYSKNNINGKELVLSPINRIEDPNKNKGFYLVYTKNFVNLKDNNKNNNLDNRVLNICLKKKNKAIENNKKDDKGINIIDDKTKKKPKPDTKEIIKRLYYKPTEKKFGFNDIKKNLKITEYVALNFAKQKLKSNKLENILKPYK